SGLTINNSTGQITPGSSTAGTYTVTYTIAASGGCASATATTSVTITNAPSATISYAGTPYCKTASPANVTLTGTSGGAFTASPVGLSLNSSSGQITPGSSTAGTYTVTYTIAASGGCASATATTSVTITDSPSASISYAGTPYCKSASPANVTLTGSSGGTFTASPVGLSLNSSSGQITPSSSTSGTYTVTYIIAASGGCASATATTSVTISNNPVPSITGTANLSCTNTFVTREASGGTTYAWSGGLGTNPVATISTPGTYTVTITSSAGCSATATTVVTSDTTPPIASITGSDDLTCTNTSVTRTASGGISYVWSNGLGNNPVATITSSGIYSVTVVSSNGCSATATTHVSFINNLLAVASDTGPYTVGQVIELNGAGGDTYAWVGPNGFTSNISNPTIADALSANGGIYTLTVGRNACTATATTNVVVNGVDPCDPTRIVDYLYVKAGNPYQPLFPLTNGMVINELSDLTSILISPVCTSTALESFEINIQGPDLNWNIIQNVNPFSLFDNLGVNVYGRNLVPGFYTLTVTGYAEDNKGGGVTYGPVITRFSIVGSSASISMPTITGNEFCAGSSVEVNFSATGTFAVGNQFQAELSDANGSFGNAVIIGTSAISGSITATIPLNTPEGSNYLIRVISTNQVVLGSATNSSLRINPLTRNLVSPTDDFTGMNMRKASSVINASNKVTATGNVSYQAGNSIVLTPGFVVESGGV
ncbi:3-coathanger stack domain-containing protein, partial [Emticicia sp. BO119]|uniref:beta strand repeat-containing protein n=1 Tax=Emticicia sp. BO119 TaxID=2757768 RepID=UPI0017FFDDE5